MSLSEWASGNIFIRPWQMKAGQVIGGHLHNFDHTSIVFTGAVHIRAEYRYDTFGCAGCGHEWETIRRVACPQCARPLDTDQAAVSQRRQLLAERDFRAPSHCLIRADVYHEVTALEDGTQFWCVYAHRNAQAAVVQEYDGWLEAYR